jgi:hypothetical protein
VVRFCVTAWAKRLQVLGQVVQKILVPMVNLKAGSGAATPVAGIA